MAVPYLGLWTCLEFPPRHPQVFDADFSFFGARPDTFLGEARLQLDHLAMEPQQV